MGRVAVFSPAALLAVWLGTVQSAHADTLTLRDGRAFSGEYAGGSRDTLHFITGGEIAHIPINDVSALSFSRREDLPVPSSAPAKKTVIVPAKSGLEYMEIQRVPADPSAKHPSK